MPASSARRAGFTLVELSVVLFVLGLLLWTVAPRLAGFGGTGREAAFRAFASASESAFDAALFEKKEWRLSIDPRNSSYRFRPPGAEDADAPRALDFGSGVAVTGIVVEGESRPTDAMAEIRYMPGGRMPELTIHLTDSAREGAPLEWTLRVDPATGSVEVLEGNVSRNA